MAERRHVLKATDNALKAFLVSEGVLESEQIGGFKEVDGKSYPFIVCASLSAERLRAKNWKVSGSITLLTSSTADPGTSDAKLEHSDEIETDLLEAFEQYIPADDYPQAVAGYIQAAAIDAGAVDANEFNMSSFMINKVEADSNEDGSWSFVIDFTAGVIA